MEGRKTKIGGVSTFNGGIYEDVVINGVITCNGDIEANSTIVDGVTTINGRIDSRESVKIDGVATVNGMIRSKDVKMGGVCTVNAIEADRVNCKGVITCRKQISADLVEGGGVLSAEEIVGEKVILHCEVKKRHWFVFDRREREYSKVRLIEATEIDIDGIKCKNLNGHNIVIGPECEIEDVDCTGELTIAPGARVKRVNGEARME